jgi:hypothetical protein
VVVDDGSRDESREVLRRYGGHARVILQENAGQAAALGRGVAATRGELVAFLDADDCWHAEKLGEAVEVFRENPRAGWLRHKLELVDERSRPLGAAAPRFRGSGTVPSDPRYLLERVVTAPTSALVLRRESLAAVFPLPAPADFAFDADVLILARLFRAGVRGHSLDRILGQYRRHSGQRWAATQDVVGMLTRELSVAGSLARELGGADRSVASQKHRAVIAALTGAPPWAVRRLRPLARGLGAALRYADVPELGTRQLGALLFAWAAPELWLRRLARNMPTVADGAAGEA